MLHFIFRLKRKKKSYSFVIIFKRIFAILVNTTAIIIIIMSYRMPHVQISKRKIIKYQINHYS